MRRGRSFRGLATGYEVNPLRRIDGLALDVERPVQMRSGGAAGGTCIPDDVPSGHVIAFFDSEARQMEVYGLQPLTMINSDGAAAQIEWTNDFDIARGDGVDGTRGGGVLIDAGMEISCRLAVM